MNDVLRLRVPPSQVQPLEQFARLSDEDAEAILEVLRTVPPLIDPALLKGRVAETAANVDALDDLVVAMMSLNALGESHGWSPRQVAQGVGAAQQLDLEDEERNSLVGRIEGALNSPSLSACAKSVGVASAHERLLHLSRVVTDVRPVFASPVAEGPLGAIVSHALELAYYGSEGSLESLYVGLDDRALQALSQTIQRAEAKSQALRRWAESVDLQVVDVDLEDA